MTIMRAAQITAYGSPDVLTVAEVPIPAIRNDQVLVRVHAAAVNPKDIFIRKGRFSHFTGRRFPIPTGFDFAGQVVAVGAGVKNTAVGEHAYGLLDGWRGGACADYVAVGANQLYGRPGRLSNEEAAALPLVALTALQALRDRAALKAGQHVCINGAAGGVGSMAVQIARAMGAAVTAVSRTDNHGFLTSLGADTCIDYTLTDITRLDRCFDLFFDVFGNRPFRTVRGTLTDRGRWVSTVVRLHVFLSIARTWLFSRQKARLVMVKSRRQDLQQVSDWVTDGVLRPIVHSVYPLEQIDAAHRQQETAHTRGKIIISMHDG